jgi:hypothetical protein
MEMSPALGELLPNLPLLKGKPFVHLLKYPLAASEKRPRLLLAKRQGLAICLSNAVPRSLQLIIKSKLFEK